MLEKNPQIILARIVVVEKEAFVCLNACVVQIVVLNQLVVNVKKKVALRNVLVQFQRRNVTLYYAKLVSNKIQNAKIEI